MQSGKKQSSQSEKYVINDTALADGRAMLLLKYTYILKSINVIPAAIPLQHHNYY